MRSMPSSRLSWEKSFSQAASAGELAELARALTQSLGNTGAEAALPLAFAIRGGLAEWQEFDAKRADHIHLIYFYQFILLSLFVAGMGGVLLMSQRARRRARLREKQSAAFSRFTVLAQENERSRIARELHDTVAQELRYLSLQTGKINSCTDPAEREALTGEVRAVQDGLARRVRNICNNLSPPDLRSQNLKDALRKLCWDWSKRTGAECEAAIEDNPCFAVLSPEMQLQCFRLVQESLSNIEKHSGASEVRVLARPLSGKEPGLLVCVQDNGSGFVPPPDSDPGQFSLRGHWGIRNMYERAAILGGSLSIESEPGQGTLIKLVVPLSPAP
jgi:signal transduction histidine kinase